VAQHPGVFVAENRPAGGDVQVVQPLAGNRQGESQPLLALAQGGLGLPLRGDRADQGAIVFAAGQLDVVGRHLDRHRRAVPAAVGGPEMEHFGLTQFPPMVGPAVGGELGIDIPHRQGQQRLPVVAERAARPVAGVENPTFRIDPEDGVRGRIGGGGIRWRCHGAVCMIIKADTCADNLTKYPL